MDKAIACKSILSDLESTKTVVCMGDGKADRGVFQVLKEQQGITVTVGKRMSNAEYYVDNVDAVVALLSCIE